jgi:hypothetical protein
MDTLLETVAWRRRGSRSEFFGALRAADDGIRLTGRDPSSGVDVALLIPADELSDVHVSANERVPHDPIVVLELDDAEPILLRNLGAGPLHAQLLARKLGALVRVPRLLVQGG